MQAVLFQILIYCIPNTPLVGLQIISKLPWYFSDMPQYRLGAAKDSLLLYKEITLKRRCVFQMLSFHNILSIPLLHVKYTNQSSFDLQLANNILLFRLLL